MSSTGINSPSVVDLVTEGSESVQLVLIETRPLVEQDASALQEKLNNYLSYALEGGLVTRFPGAAGKQTCIRIDLYAQPDTFIKEFVRRYSAALIQHGVSLEANVNGEALT
jgi:hypothetical protein